MFPDGNSGNGNVPAWVLPFMGGNFGNNGGLFGGNNGWGGGILGFLLGLMFGNGGFGNFFGGTDGTMGMPVQDSSLTKSTMTLVGNC